MGYEGTPDTYILSKNLASALVGPAVIDKKLIGGLSLGRVVEVVKSTSPSIYSLLKFVPKHDGGLRRIHHFSFWSWAWPLKMFNSSKQASSLQTVYLR